MNQNAARPRTTLAGRRIPLALLALLVGCGEHDLPNSPAADQQLEATPGPAFEAGISTPGCSGYSFVRQVSVSSPSQLGYAISNARAGDLIRMADGVYKGFWRATRSGTSSQPIILCGSRKAIIDGGGTTNSGFALQFHGASHWVVDGITVRNRNQGLEIRGGGSNVVRNIECHTLGYGCVHLWMHTKQNILERNWIHHTGGRNAEWGEGIYLGSAQSKWSTLTKGPDRTDYNIIRQNKIGPYVTAEHIDAKPGTAYNRIEGNIFDGTGQRPCCASRGAIFVNSWIEINGNDYTVTGNVGSRPIKWGYETYRIDLNASGSRCTPGTSGCVAYGNRTRYENNHADLSGAQISGGAGFGLEKSTSGSVVRCTNSTQAGTLVKYNGSTVSCTW